MLSFTGSLRVFVALEACDMRKGFDGLSGMVASKLNEDVQSGALFVFSNRSHTRLKIIYWDGSGLWLMAKRLEKGTFSWPKDTDGKTKLALRPEALAMLTDGVDLRGGRMRAWYQREA
jgi:transposase